MIEKWLWFLNKNSCTDFSCDNNKQGLCKRNLTYD